MAVIDCLSLADFEARIVKLSASVAFLTLLCLPIVSPEYCLGSKLQRRSCHLALNLTSLQLWDIEDGVRLLFLIFNHLWDYLGQTGRIFPNLWAEHWHPRMLTSCFDSCSSNSQLHCFGKDRLWLKNPLSKQLLSSGHLKGIIAPVCCHLGLVLKMQAYRTLILDVRIRWIIKGKNGSEDYPVVSSFPLSPLPSYTHTQGRCPVSAFYFLETKGPLTSHSIHSTMR